MVSGSTRVPSPASAAGVSGRTAPEAARRGLFCHWGPQAWIDMVMSKRMLVDRAGLLVPYTFLPILRLSGA